MISRDIIKMEIDRVPEVNLAALYRLVKALEIPLDDRPADLEQAQNISAFLNLTPVEKRRKLLRDADKLSPSEVMALVYGCLADDPIEREPQGDYELREPIL